MKQNKKKQNKIDITHITIAVISLILLAMVIYYDNETKENNEQITLNKMQDAYNAGAQDGQIAVAKQVFKMGIECQQIPLTMDNMTVNLIAIECLQQQQQQ